MVNNEMNLSSMSSRCMMKCPAPALCLMVQLVRGNEPAHWKLIQLKELNCSSSWYGAKPPKKVTSMILLYVLTFSPIYMQLVILTCQFNLVFTYITNIMPPFSEFALFCFNCPIEGWCTLGACDFTDFYPVKRHQGSCSSLSSLIFFVRNDVR